MTMMTAAKYYDRFLIVFVWLNWLTKSSYLVSMCAVELEWLPTRPLYISVNCTYIDCDYHQSGLR